MISEKNPDPETLRQFLPLEALGSTQLKLLASTVEVERAEANCLLIKRGSQDDFSFFLLEGELRLRAEDGRMSKITAGDPTSRNPIAQLQPRHYDVLSTTPVAFIRITNALLASIAAGASRSADLVAGYEVSGEQSDEGSDFENQLSYQFLSDLEQDKLILPSLPEVAARIGRALEDNISDAATIADMIQTDPVITAKLIKAANSAMYGRKIAAESCTDAVIRLGTQVTHKLVISYALRELFKSDSDLLQKRMQGLWSHSTKVAAICYVLAKYDNRFNPEHAMLIGLLHDIGIVAVLNYARNFPMEARQPEVIDQAIKRLRAQTGSLILKKWGFPTEFMVAALEGEDWMRNKGLAPDYCDLVIIAQLHSFVGTGEALSAPAINEVPAHARLALGELTPRLSLKILDQAKDQITHTESLLNI